jgi:hypothetical protein
MRKLLLTILLSKTIALTAQVNLTQSHLPIFVINTPANVAIPDEPKITADLKVYWQASGLTNRMTDSSIHYKGKIGIEKRGNSSQSNSEKKPYSLEIRDSLGNDLSFPLLGLPKHSDWALVAPYADKTLVRDALVYQLAGSFMSWAPRTRYCEVILNGKYEGVYLLTERIKRDKSRVNISKQDSTATAGDALTGGYIFQCNRPDGTDSTVKYGYRSQFDNLPNKRTFYEYVYPKYEEIEPAQRNYLNSVIHEFESLMNTPQYDDPLNGYSKLIDVATFVDFFLVQEMGHNVDAYRVSSYMFKDKNSVNSKIRMGPVWDFNTTFGNIDYCKGAEIQGWSFNFNDICPTHNYMVPFWWKKLWADRNFKSKVRARWQSLRKNELSIAKVNASIDSLTTRMGDATARNFTKYPILGKYVWPNAYFGKTHAEDVSYLKKWIADRFAWLDGEMALLPTNLADLATRETRVYPNPSNAAFYFDISLKENANVKVLIYNQLGQIIETIEQKKYANEKPLVWESNVPKGLYFYTILLNENIFSSGKLVKN